MAVIVYPNDSAQKDSFDFCMEKEHLAVGSLTVQNSLVYKVSPSLVFCVN